MMDTWACQVHKVEAVILLDFLLLLYQCAETVSVDWCNFSPHVIKLYATPKSFLLGDPASNSTSCCKLTTLRHGLTISKQLCQPAMPAPSGWR